MSIQSEINRISGEVTTQTDLLGQIAAELAGKAAGGDIEIQTDKEAVTPSNVAQTVWPDSGYDALAKVTVKAIPSEYIIPSGTKNITANGTHDVTQYAQAVVSVDAPEPVLQSKEVSPSTSSQTVKPDSGYDGLSQVTVSAMPTATQATPSVSIDSAGKITATATQSAGYVSAGTKTGTKQLTTQAAKTVTPTKSSQTAVSKNVYTTGVVTVGAIPDAYQDVSGVTASADDVVTGKKIVSASGAVISGSNPYVKTTTDSTVSTQSDLISQIQTALQGKTAGGGATPTLQEKTVTPSETAQTVTPDSGYDGLSKVSVSAISKTYVGSSVTRKSAQTYTPGTSNQTIASGQYLSGTQTIKGDANLVAGNIKSGVDIFGVLGTFEGESSGGGLPKGVSAMDYGTFVLAADSNAESVAHNLGVRPDFAVWWLDDAHSVESGGALRGSLTHSTVDTETFNVGYISVGYKTDGTLDFSKGSIQGLFYMNATRIGCYCSSDTPFKAGYTYHWIAGALDTAL